MASDYRGGGPTGVQLDCTLMATISHDRDYQRRLDNQAALNLARFTSGNFYWKGMIDEARIESVARSSNWVWATWMTVASNSALASYEG